MARSDWIPGGRIEQLNMAKQWVMVFNESTKNKEGQSVKKYVAWGIPPATNTEFSMTYAAAQEALEACLNKDTRNKIDTQRCESAFKRLTDILRDTRKRYLYIPPLQDTDMVSLSLSLKDTIPTPTAHVQATPFLISQHEAGFRIEFVSSNPDDTSNKLFRVHYILQDPGDPPPASPGQLTESFSTKRRRDIIQLPFEASGKKIYMAVQIENNKLKGPWGPITSMLVP